MGRRSLWAVTATGSACDGGGCAVGSSPRSRRWGHQHDHYRSGGSSLPGLRRRHDAELGPRGADGRGACLLRRPQHARGRHRRRDRDPAGGVGRDRLSVRATYARVVEFVRAGRVPYLDAWDRQRELHGRRVADEIPDTVLLLEHDPVYTAGKRTEAWERPVNGTGFNGTGVIDVDRGGRITWH